MRIVIKFILRNIMEKKIMTLMIIFSIVVSSALFFSTLAISKNLENMYMKQITKYFGSAEIMISVGKDSPSNFFNPLSAYKYRGNTDYMIGVLLGNGSYRYKNESVKVSMQGIRFDELNVMNPVILKNKASLIPFTGNKIIISSRTAEKYSLKAGDNIELKINNSNHKFKICGIAQPSGYFLEFGQEVVAVVPRETLADIYNAKGNVNAVYIKLKDITMKDILLDNLSAIYPRYEVKDTISDSEKDTSVGRISTSFRLMTIAVLFISIFIIYTSFRVISMERMPVIGTFRSIGATKKITTGVLVLESAIYGVIGGLIGCLTGLGVLRIMVYYITPSWLKEANLTIPVEFSPLHLLIAFLMGFMMAVVSSSVPIIKASIIPIKDVVLNKIEKDVSRKKGAVIIGIILWISALVISPYIPVSLAVAVNTICAVAIILGIIMIIPTLTNILIKLMEKIYAPIFGNEGIIAAKNMKDNKNMINNICLLAIGLSASLMINTFGVSFISAIVDAYRDMKFEVQITVDKADRMFESTVRTIDGVQSTYGSYEGYGVEIAGQKQKINTLYGINTDKYLQFFNINTKEDKQALLKKLNQGRFILVSNTLRMITGIQKGDIITLKMENGNNDYQIIGFYDTLGKEALISERYLKMDMKKSYYSQIYIKTTKDPKEIESTLKQKNRSIYPEVITVEQMKQDTMDSNKQIMAVMEFFSMMALVVGAIGVANNFLVSFIERKRSFAVLRSIGMGKKQVVKMIFIESMSGGFIGGVVGVLGGVSLLLVLPYIMVAMSLPITINFTVDKYIMYLFAGILISVCASISPAVKTSKLKIIESIKFE